MHWIPIGWHWASFFKTFYFELEGKLLDMGGKKWVWDLLSKCTDTAGGPSIFVYQPFKPLCAETLEGAGGRMQDARMRARRRSRGAQGAASEHQGALKEKKKKTTYLPTTTYLFLLRFYF
jgi:hypothetical protein